MLRAELGLGKKAFRPKWTSDQIALLGAAADDVVARQIGVSRRTLRAKRKALGIPAYSAAHPSQPAPARVSR